MKNLPIKKSIRPEMKKKLEREKDKMARKKTELPLLEDGTVKEKDKYTDIKWFHFRKKGLGFFAKRRLQRKPETSFLISMFFSNGTCKEFVITTNKETFDYMGKTYYLRYEDSWFNLTQSQYELNFFEDYPVPIDREVMKKGDKRFWTVTSENLKPIIKMEYVKALASSQELNKYLKMTSTLSVIVLFIQLAILYFIFKVARYITIT